MNLLSYAPSIESKLSQAFPRDGIQVEEIMFDTKTGNFYICFRLDPRAREAIQ